jgi:flotillin
MAGFVIPIAVVIGFFVLMVLAAYIASRYKKVGPNQVLIISGRGSSIVDPTTDHKQRIGFRVVRGGGTVILPVLERVDVLSLEVMTIEVTVNNVYTVQGVPVNVDGVAQIKVAGDDVSIRTAAEQFLSMDRQQIMHVAHETLAGHLRAILGTMTVEEIYKDRDAFAQQVNEHSGVDLAKMGLTIVSFTIKDIHDDEGYLDALGQERIAQVKRDATIGQAEAARDATIRSAHARQEGETAKFQAETRIAESDKEYKVQKASYDAETNRRRAEAELAYTLQQNITNQQVKGEEVQIEVIAKQKQIEVQQQEALRKEKELEATVRRPAEAEQYRIQTLAEAKRFQTQTEAEGEAAALRQVGEGEAGATRAKGLAEAEVIKAKGLAEAEVIKAKGFAEAQAMEKKAEAWQNYNQAPILLDLIQSLPQVAAAVAQPLAQTERIVVISSGGGDGAGAGASRVARDVADIVSQVPATVEALTGINLIETLQNLPIVSGGGTKPKGKKPPVEG